MAIRFLKEGRGRHSQRFDCRVIVDLLVSEGRLITPVNLTAGSRYE